MKTKYFGSQSSDGSVKWWSEGAWNRMNFGFNRTRTYLVWESEESEHYMEKSEYNAPGEKMEKFRKRMGSADREITIDA